MNSVQCRIFHDSLSFQKNPESNVVLFTHYQKKHAEVTALQGLHVKQKEQCCLGVCFASKCVIIFQIQSRTLQVHIEQKLTKGLHGFLGYRTAEFCISGSQGVTV